MKSKMLAALLLPTLLLAQGDTVKVVSRSLDRAPLTW